MASIVGEIGFLIAIPLVVCALIGRAVDSALGSSPFFFLIGILGAIALSTVMVYRKTKEMIDYAEKEMQNVKCKMQNDSSKPKT